MVFFHLVWLIHYLIFKINNCRGGGVIENI